MKESKTGVTHPFQGQGVVAFEDFLAKGLRSAKAAMGHMPQFVLLQKSYINHIIPYGKRT